MRLAQTADILYVLGIQVNVAGRHDSGIRLTIMQRTHRQVHAHHTSRAGCIEGDARSLDVQEIAQTIGHASTTDTNDVVGRPIQRVTVLNITVVCMSKLAAQSVFAATAGEEWN